MKKYLISIVSFIILLYFWSSTFHSFLMAFTLLLCLGCHELGHMIGARQKGIEVSAPVFLPIGAFIHLRSAPKNAEDESYMALAGPFAGTLATAIVHLSCLVLLAGGIINPFAAGAVIYAVQLSYFLNLFNLIPFAPMDGGRALQVVSRHLWVLGLGLLIFLFSAMPASSMLTWVLIGLIFWSGVQDVRYRKHLAKHNPAYYQSTTGRRFRYLGVYAALLAVLLLMVVYFPAITRGLLNFLGV